MSPFRYDNLSHSRAIRVLRLQPGSSRAAPLVCKLTEVSLDDGPAYEALSYTWGDPGLRDSIVCNGVAVSVTTNLASALRLLRLAGRERTLWADAICINQQDQNEIGQQVRMMDDVYRLARQVVIYLGDDDDDQEAAFELLDRLAEVRSKTENNGDNGNYQALDPDKLQELGVPKLGAQEWRPLVRLFRRPYFGRMWIQQEVALSQAATVYCGQSERPWARLGEAARFLVNSTLAQELCIGGIGSCARIDAYRRGVAAGDQRKPIGYYATIQGCRNSGCANPRDKVYALLGMINEPGDRFDTIDYGAPVADVYAAFTLFLIRKEKSLKILGAREDPAARTQKLLPTWVADWPVQCLTRQLGLLSKYSNYRAAADTVPTVSLREGHILSVRGSIFDAVEDVGSYFQARFTAVDDIAIPDDWIQMLFRNQLYPRGADRLMVFFGILAAGLGAESAYSFLCWFRKTYGRALTSQVEQEGEEKVDKHARMFKFIVLDRSNGTSFLTTEIGYAGTGPPSTQPGDLICVLDGGPVPFVLRQRYRGEPATYELIGECYIQGMMNGELRFVSSREFLIC